MGSIEREKIRENFRTDLKSLLAKYNAEIEIDLYNATMEVLINKVDNEEDIMVSLPMHINKNDCSY